MPGQPRPRDLIQGSPEQFGFQPNARWKQPTTLDELVRLRHAEMQHEFAFRVRMHLRERGLSQARFIGVAKDEPDGANWFPKDHFGRGINGTARFTLDQLLRIEQHTGPILTRLKFPRTVLTNPGLIQAVPHADGVDHDVYRHVHGRPHPHAESARSQDEPPLNRPRA
ncbi:hypothetical protein J2X46_002363 [Nocardioides sp. BE266]|uniref:hypothetical protein n=1 Tax=Nocardioides sp. BE266 TaxID=2817725 RepID=UPI00285F50F6|nr:hypothetical protein [Nocardioides sp. BE266]MDR7253378.1 hypothetical protein [Nocardioides sp. BE266]